MEEKPKKLAAAPNIGPTRIEAEKIDVNEAEHQIRLETTGVDPDGFPAEIHELEENDHDNAYYDRWLEEWENAKKELKEYEEKEKKKVEKELDEFSEFFLE